VAATIGKLGENMAVPRFVRYGGKGFVGQYIHPPGKIGVQVELTGVTPEVARRQEFKTLVNEIALQIAAASPTYGSRADVPRDVIEREKSIYRAQVEGKPANVIEKIVEGKLGSFYEQVVLVDQLSIRPEPKQTVGKLIEGVSKALGVQVVVSRFARLNVKEQS
jgi:elongation factor Ts